MTIVKDGYPFILGSLAAALAVWYGAGIIWCIPSWFLRHILRIFSAIQNALRSRILR